jgi:hypothetical protein
VTLDSLLFKRRRQLLADFRETEQLDQAKTLEGQAAQSSSGKGGLDVEGILKEDQYVKLDAMSEDSSQSFSELDNARLRFNKTKIKLDSNQFGPGENRDMVLKDSSYQEAELAKVQEIAEIKSKSLLEDIKEIRKSDSFDWFWDLIDNYKHFLDTLSLDQKVAILNLLGYYMIFNLAVSIAFILGVNHLIQLLNLEAKYP